MEPLPAPNVPGDTPAERLSNALRMALRVSRARRRQTTSRENESRAHAKTMRPSDYDSGLVVIAIQLD